MKNPVALHKKHDDYQQRQEQAVTKALEQIGDSYTSARLQITLEHIHLIPQSVRANAKQSASY